MKMSKTAVITGGSSGLGLALAERLGEQGYALHLIARDSVKLAKAQTLLVNNGFRASTYACDVQDDLGLSVIFTTIKQQTDRIDFLILSAGIVRPSLLAEYPSIAAIKEEIGIDLLGAIIPSRIFQPLLTASSKVLYISSGFGLMGTAGYSVYCAAKAGVVNFAAAMRHELLSKEIAVYVACPADIDTPQFHQEKSDMPDWMTVADARGKVMSAQTCADKILRRCKGKRFMIIINPDIALLVFMKKLLPEYALNFILDRMFPKPS